MTDDDSKKAGTITTNTIAELYIKQGYLDKAIDIYKAILEIDPSNESAGVKIREIESMMAGTSNEEVEPSSTSIATSTAISVESQVARLESWLATIQDMRSQS